MKKVSALEPAPRCHAVEISTGELAALIRHHELFNKVLERELPALAAQHCRDAAQREGVLRAAAQQLSAHERRLDELRGWLATTLAEAEALDGPRVASNDAGEEVPIYHPDTQP